MGKKTRRNGAAVVIAVAIAFSMGSCSSDDDGGSSTATTTSDDATTGTITTDEDAATAAYDEAFDFCSATDYREVGAEYGVPGEPTIGEAAAAYAGEVGTDELGNDTYRGCLDGFQAAAGG